jgi:fructokinase
MIRIGIDMGGTKMEAIALTDDGRIIARRRVPTPRGDYQGTLDALAGLVETLESETGERATVGVGIPGTISPATGLVKNANSIWLIGHPLEQDLSARMGKPVRLANDANCFALSEASDGAGEGAAVVFGVIVGTGTGGGIVVNGHVITGANAVAGEWGHNPMPWPQPEEWPGPECYCGRHGCIESFLSGPGLARDHDAVTGERLTSEQIVERASNLDAAAEATLQRYEERMARALSAVINLLDPDVIVLGGGLSKLERLYRNVPPRLGRWVFTDRVDSKLLPPRHGDASGVRGAAWLWQPGERP